MPGFPLDLSFGVPLSGMPDGKGGIMTANPVTWFEIYVDNIDRAQAFYENLLGVRLAPSPMPDGEMDMRMFPAEMDGAGAPGALIHHPMRQPSAQGNLVYFSVEECGSSVEWARQEGVMVIVEKQSIGEHGFIAIISDSEGNSIGLHSWN